jgi:hypothetical protein
MELAKVIAQKILRDKILLGLVVVGILGLFVGGMTMGDDKPDGKNKEQALPAGAQAPGAQPAAQQAQAPGQKLDPQLATDFIKWWFPVAMDYSQNPQQNHTEALKWMTPESAQVFQSAYWSAETVSALSSGRLAVAFQPTVIQAQAINPDGSVVVGVQGQLVTQTAGQPQPETQQYVGSFLVRQERSGLRVAGLSTQYGVIPGAAR